MKIVKTLLTLVLLQSVPTNLLAQSDTLWVRYDNRFKANGVIKMNNADSIAVTNALFYFYTNGNKKGISDCKRRYGPAFQGRLPDSKHRHLEDSLCGRDERIYQDLSGRFRDAGHRALQSATSYGATTARALYAHTPVLYRLSRPHCRRIPHQCPIEQREVAACGRSVPSCLRETPCFQSVKHLYSHNRQHTPVSHAIHYQSL